MGFASLLFVTLFLPLYVASYLVAPRAARNGVLLALSVAFYAWGAPRFVPIVLALGVVDHVVARAIARRRGTGAAKRLLVLAIVLHVAVLGYFKYANFAVGAADSIRAALGMSELATPWTAVILPIGISFLTFEAISYLVDVYRGEASPATSVSTYLLFLLLFPHAIAGPIFRWKDLEGQLTSRSTSLDDVVTGLTRFIWGLGKKVLVADAAAITADAAFGLAPGQATAHIAWVGALAYTVQIYFDFSGYSDMAIGLGRVAGFRFKENFDNPYASSSVSEFWTRWHISLSTWMRDYLYVPLGGNRAGEWRTRLHVLVVFAVSGFWHGAAWTFLLWGVFHGAVVVIERTALGRFWHTHAPRVARIGLTFLLVVFGWVLFRARDFGQAWSLITAMCGGAGPVPVEPLMRGELLPTRSLVFMALGLSAVAARALLADVPRRSGLRHLAMALAPAVLVASVVQIANTKFVPLIYFRF